VKEVEEPAAEPEPEPEPEPKSGDVAEDAAVPLGTGLLGELFDRLRAESSGEKEPSGATEAEEPELPVPSVAAPTSEAIERRDRLLLSVQNQGVKEVRRQLVELQNLEMDAIRIAKRKPWAIDDDRIHRALAVALNPLMHDAAEAGAAAAAQVSGGSPAPVIEVRSAELIGAMAQRLVADLEDAAERGGPGGQVSSEAARVFRSWRNDAVERWVRTVAYAGYHDSLLAGLVASGVTEVIGVRHGHLCTQCPASSGDRWDPAGDPPEGTKVPPAHVDCTCTLSTPS
jgi:hypothetical protein